VVVAARAGCYGIPTHKDRKQIQPVHTAVKNSLRFKLSRSY
jgi:hypothetical protein